MQGATLSASVKLLFALRKVPKTAKTKLEYPAKVSKFRIHFSAIISFLARSELAAVAEKLPEPAAVRLQMAALL